MRGLRPRVEAPLDPRTTLSGAAERGLQTLRAPRYDLPASLVLALVLAHDPLPPLPLHRHTFFLFRAPPPFPRVHWVTISFPSRPISLTYVKNIFPTTVSSSRKGISQVFDDVSRCLTKRLFFSKKDLASVTFDDVSGCLTKRLFFSKRDLVSVTFDDVSRCLIKLLFFSKKDLASVMFQDV